LIITSTLVRVERENPNELRIMRDKVKRYLKRYLGRCGKPADLITTFLSLGI